MIKPEPERRRRVIAVALLAGGLAYLATFVPRGWIAHDEGTIGQVAEWVARGDIPHVDFEDPYTGGMSWMYAWVFRYAGADLLYIRILLFGGAVIAVTLTYFICRRFL